MERKIVVPPGMLKAVEDRFGVIYASGYREKTAIADLEAALGWLTENPIVPTIKQINEMHDSPLCPDGGTYLPYYLAEWQRRMFLAPEPEYPQEIKDLLSRWNAGGINSEPNSAQRDIIEAYKRGQKAGK